MATVQEERIAKEAKKKIDDTCLILIPPLSGLNKLDGNLHYHPYVTNDDASVGIITNDETTKRPSQVSNDDSSGSKPQSSLGGSVLGSLFRTVLYEKAKGLLRSAIIMYSWLNYAILYSLLYVLVCLPCKYVLRNDYYYVEVENFIFTTMSYHMLKLFHLQGLRLIECGDDSTQMKYRTRVTFWDQYNQCRKASDATTTTENEIDDKDNRNDNQAPTYDCHRKRNEKTKAIIMANHTRNIDGPIMQCVANDWIKSNTLFIARGFERFAQTSYLLIAGHGSFFIENRKKKDKQINKRETKVDKTTLATSSDETNTSHQSQHGDATKQSLTRTNEKTNVTVNQSRQLMRLRQHLLNNKRKNVLFIFPEGGTYEINVSSKESKMRNATTNCKAYNENQNSLIRKISPYKYLLVPKSGGLKQMLHPDIKVTHVVDLTVIWEHQFHKTTSMWKFLTLNFKGRQHSLFFYFIKVSV